VTEERAKSFSGFADVKMFSTFKVFFKLAKFKGFLV